MIEIDEGSTLDEGLTLSGTPRQRRKKREIVIPGAEHMTPEELKRAKHNEKMRRYMMRSTGKEATLTKQTNQSVRKMDTAEMVEMAKDTRNLAITVLNKKLLGLADDEEELKKVNMATLATVFGILFDKAQLAAGLATENIAIHAKIDVNMTSDKALQELNKMREQFTSDNVK